MYNHLGISRDRGDRMDEKKIVRCADRRQWREWLAEHFETENEVWFVFPRLASGEKGVSYNDAVEEALCFGWIDSTARTLDDAHQLRRFNRGGPAAPIRGPISSG